MTVCIAAICYWPKDNKPGWAVITAADRMITRRQTSEYEPAQEKIGQLQKTVAVLPSGDNLVHTEAFARTFQALEVAPMEDVGEIAELYGSYVSAFRHREAAHDYLLPVGLEP